VLGVVYGFNIRANEFRQDIRTGAGVWSAAAGSKLLPVVRGHDPPPPFCAFEAQQWETDALQWDTKLFIDI